MGRERVPSSERSEAMDRPQDRERDLPSDDEEIAREGEKNRREMDEVPPHGTDPLHEGP
jgi:hypothetical protein